MENLSSMVSPQTGRCVSIIEIPDEVFSERILGDGIAIIPQTEEVLSPVDGEVAQVAETKHAFCINSNDGLELMIHIGVDTVKLNGKGFECFIKKGDKIKKGDLIAKADIKFIQENGFPLHTAILITNSNKFQIVKPHYGEVNSGKDIVLEYMPR